MAWQQQFSNLISEQNYKKAAEVCETVIQLNPKEVQASFNLGLAYLLQGQEEEAQAVWLWGIFESPCSLDGEQRNQSLIKTLKQQAQTEITQENWQNSQLIYQQLQELIPDDIHVLLSLLETTLRTGELTLAKLEEWNIIGYLKDASSKTINHDSIILILNLIFQFPIPGLEELVVVLLDKIKSYKQFEKIVTDNTEKLHLLSITAYESQQYQVSISLLQIIITSQPDSALAYNSLGNALEALGNLEGAKSNYRKALSISPDLAIIYYNLGNILRVQGELNVAANYYKKALELDPTLDRVYINLGLLYKKQEKYYQAIECYKELLERYPEHSEGYNNLGLLWLTIKDYQTAEESLKHAVEIKPEYVDAYNNLGSLYEEQGKIEEATIYYEKAIKYKNTEQNDQLKLADSYYRLGCLLFEQKELEAAESLFQKALKLNPNSTDILRYLGLVYKEQENASTAIEYFEKLIEVAPDIAESYADLANLYREFGQIDTALSYYQLAFNITFRSPYVHYLFSECHTYQSQEDNYFQTLLCLEKDQQLYYTSKILIRFALAKAWRDMKQYDQEFLILEQANAMKRSEFQYSIDKEIEQFEDIQKKFNVNTLSEFQNIELGSVKKTPIFIIGMPRSGTTLTEQIIASHSKVIGLGELGFLPNLIHKNLILKNKDLIYDLETISKEVFIDTQKKYIKQVSRRDQEHSYFIDKMVYNFKFIGFIKILFPQAKVIHCLRHPLDTCLANYQRFFTIRNYHSYNLEELGRYYLAYHQLMQHWYSILPGFLYPLHYEKLVTNQKEEISKLLRFCGLNWEDNVLSFQNNKRSIRTASVVQVRQKIYTSSANKWHRYAKHLEPLKQFFEENNIL